MSVVWVRGIVVYVTVLSSLALKCCDNTIIYTGVSVIVPSIMTQKAFCLAQINHFNMSWKARACFPESYKPVKCHWNLILYGGSYRDYSNWEMYNSRNLNTFREMHEVYKSNYYTIIHYIDWKLWFTSIRVIFNILPFDRQIIQFEFSPTWSCVSLTRSTTSSEWKLFRCDKMGVTGFKYCWLMSHFIFKMFKRWYLMC